MYEFWTKKLDFRLQRGKLEDPLQGSMTRMLETRFKDGWIF